MGRGSTGMLQHMLTNTLRVQTATNSTTRRCRRPHTLFLISSSPTWIYLPPTRRSNQRCNVHALYKYIIFYLSGRQILSGKPAQIFVWKQILFWEAAKIFVCRRILSENLCKYLSGRQILAWEAAQILVWRQILPWDEYTQLLFVLVMDFCTGCGMFIRGYTWYFRFSPSHDCCCFLN